MGIGTQLDHKSTVLSFDDDRRSYLPGDTVAGGYHLTGFEPSQVKAVELSVLWYTEGTGEEDLAVIFFDRVEPAATGADLRQPRRFSALLPLSPLSYAGVSVKICWCVRARVFLTQGKDLVAEAGFRLGNVPEAHEVVS